MPRPSNLLSSLLSSVWVARHELSIKQQQTNIYIIYNIKHVISRTLAIQDTYRQKQDNSLGP